jgi:hypothetical protein
MACTYVVVSEVEAPQGKKGTDTKQQVGHLFESLPFDQRPSLPWLDVNAKKGDGDSRSSQENKAHCSNRPSDTDRLQHESRYGWEYYAARGSAGRSKGNCEGAILVVVVGGNEADHGCENQAVTNAHKDTLADEESRIVLSNRRGEDADHLESASRSDRSTQVARVESATRESANEEDKKELNGADPRDSRE